MPVRRTIVAVSWLAFVSCSANEPTSPMGNVGAVSGELPASPVAMSGAIAAGDEALESVPGAAAESPAVAVGGPVDTAVTPMIGVPSPVGADATAGAMPVAGEQAADPTMGSEPVAEEPLIDPADLEPFSFFVTSLGAMQMLSGNPDGFGGDLRYGEETGLAGADKICTEVAEMSMEGAAAKEWRAFLSTTQGGADGGPIHAKDRIGQGPWYDRLGRLVAMNLTDLINERPQGADPAILNDLPNEFGIPNHLDGADVTSCGSGLDTPCPDNHDVMTGSNAQGMIYNAMDATYTCNDWTSSEGDTTVTSPGFPGFPGGGFPGGGFPGFPGGTGGGQAAAVDGVAFQEGNPLDRGEGPWCGHSWPREFSGIHWISALREGGCAPCARVVEMGGPNAKCVGSGGGYGGIYCFALNP